MLARVVLCVLLALGVNACGSRVIYHSAAPAAVDDHGLALPAAADEPPAEFGEATQAEPPTGPEHAPRQRPKSRAGCDWHANLERATAGRPIDWIVSDTGAWGRAEVPGTRIWIAPRTPCDKVYSVAVHEWAHHMQGVVYGDWGLVTRELAPYGGAEAVADCGALLLGASWIKYGCPGQRSSDVAFAILRGQRP